MKPAVLIYSKDPDFFLIFGHILSVSGFDSHLFQALREASSTATDARLIAVVMDCQSGDRAAARICATLRSAPATGAIPIAALIAPKAGALHLEMIKAGVDESFSRPFAPERLLAWLHAKANLTEISVETEAGDLIQGEFRLERRTHRIFFRETEIATPPIEFKLLRCMMAKPGAVLSREELIKLAWPDHSAEADLRSVDVHVARLRKRLKATIGQDVIRTVRSVGYAFAPDW